MKGAAATTSIEWITSGLRRSTAVHSAVKLNMTAKEEWSVEKTQHRRGKHQRRSGAHESALIHDDVHGIANDRGANVREWATQEALPHELHSNGGSVLVASGS